MTRKQGAIMRAVMFGLAIVVLALPTKSFAADPLEGKWAVTVTPDEDSRKGGEKEFTDTLEFKANKFVSEECKKKGFDAVAYEEDTRRFGPAKFTAEPK